VEPDRGVDIFVMDGECGLCHRMARFMRPRLRNPTSLEFVALQSERGANLLATLEVDDRGMDTVHLFRRGRSHQRSAAAVRGLLYLRWWWWIWFPVVWLIPLPLRDLVYRIVARNRHRLFAKPESCDL